MPNKYPKGGNMFQCNWLNWRASCFLTVLVVSLVVFAGAPARAQVLYGSLVGTVTDPTGAVIPNASVTITDSQTGVSREEKTDGSGRYSVANLAPGTYSVRVTA